MCFSSSDPQGLDSTRYCGTGFFLIGNARPSASCQNAAFRQGRPQKICSRQSIYKQCLIQNRCSNIAAPQQIRLDKQS